MLFDELKGARRVNYNRDWCGDRSLQCLCCQQLVGALGGVLGTRLLLHNRQRTGPPPLVTPVMQLQDIQYTAVRVVTDRWQWLGRCCHAWDQALRHLCRNSLRTHA
jgi:hypothetical protein